MLKALLDALFFSCLQEIIEDTLPEGVKNFDQCKIRLAVSAFDVSRLTERNIAEGRIAPALRASCTFPVLFSPVWHPRGVLIDGGVMDTTGERKEGGRHALITEEKAGEIPPITGLQDMTADSDLGRHQEGHFPLQMGSYALANAILTTTRPVPLSSCMPGDFFFALVKNRNVVRADRPRRLPADPERHLRGQRRQRNLRATFQVRHYPMLCFGRRYMVMTKHSYWVSHRRHFTSVAVPEIFPMSVFDFVACLANQVRFEEKSTFALVNYALRISASCVSLVSAQNLHSLRVLRPNSRVRGWCGVSRTRSAKACCPSGRCSQQEVRYCFPCHPPGRATYDCIICCTGFNIFACSFFQRSWR